MMLPLMKQPAVCILASKRNGTLYIGVTSDLVRRIWEHRNDQASGFTRKHNVHMLVHFELHGDMTAAMTREKQLKKWNRAWKISLIEETSPQWCDLFPGLARSARARECDWIPACAGMTISLVVRVHGSVTSPSSVFRTGYNRT